MRATTHKLCVRPFAKSWFRSSECVLRKERRIFVKFTKCWIDSTSLSLRSWLRLVIVSQVASFHSLTKSLNRVEVGTVRWQIYRFDVMPIQALGFMPAGVVEHEQNAFASTLRHLYGHRIKEDLENRRVAVRHD
jgi:hypothetical protein